MKLTRTTTLAALLTAVVLSLTACGQGSVSGDGGGASPAAGETTASQGKLTAVSVGVLPIAPSVGVYYGVEKGIFEEHGFDVTLETNNSGAAMLPAVSNGQVDFGVGNPLSVMTAADRGLEMKIVSGYSNSLAEGKDVAGVVTRADSGIDSFADLAGKTTAINALKTQGDLTIMEAAEKEGADPQALRFSELPFPDMPAQLERGNADAVWVPEPFLSRLLADDANRLVGYSFQEAIPGMPTMVTFTSGAKASEDPEMVREFDEAMTAALEAAEADDEGVRTMLSEFIDMPQDEAQSLTMEELSGELPREELTKIGEVATKYEFISKAPNEEQLCLD